MLDTIAILERYFQDAALQLIIDHGRAVAGLAGGIGRALELPGEDLDFIDEAAMLHDIGVCRVRAPEIGLHGEFPYIMHGILGREILEAQGLPLHALVCERHIGVGLSVADIVCQQLPLPHRAMLPISVAEKVICFADLFYSKSPEKLGQRKSVAHVRNKLVRFGNEKLQIFDTWYERFGAVLLSG